MGAPFEYSGKITEGGAVYVYFSSGVKRGKFESAKVFLKPIRILGKGSYSQFGASIAPLGNIDGDPHHLNGNFFLNIGVMAKIAIQTSNTVVFRLCCWCSLC